MNIELHGFPQEKVKNIVDAIWGKFLSHLDYLDSADCVVTVVQCQTENKHSRSEPFIRVYSDKESDFEFVAKHFKLVQMPGAGIRLYVECILLHKCIEL